MNAQQVWQAQSIDAPRISLDYVRYQVGEFERRRRARARFGYGVLVLAGCLQLFAIWQFAGTKPLLALSSVCFVIMIVSSVLRLYRHLSAESSPADAGTLDTLRYQRRMLVRQRDYRRNDARFAIPAVLPGFLLLFASQIFENDPVPWMAMFRTGVVMVVAMVLAVVGCRRKAEASQREIDALDSLAGDR